MVWEAALWCGLALGGPVLIRVLGPWLRSRWEGPASLFEELGPWLNLLPLYLALITGAVSGRDAGLYGQPASSWANGALISVITVALVTPMLWWKPMAGQWPEPWRGTSDEARWALYRASGALWSGPMLGGAAVGLVLAVGEWALETRPWCAERRTVTWLPLARPLISAVLFALARNAWLTAATHLALLVIARRMTQPKRSG
ncbi:MAG: hypothetical protein AB1449_05435 [Chloroflexota bacterium]